MVDLESQVFERSAQHDAVLSACRLDAHVLVEHVVEHCGWVAVER